MPSLSNPAAKVLASSLATQACLVVTGPLTVRLLGVEARGEVAFIVATVLLISQVGPWGLPQACAYFIARSDTTARELLDAYMTRYARRTALIAGAAGLAVLAASRWATPLTEPLAEALLATAGTAGIMIAVLALACLTGEQRFTALALLQAVPGVSYTVAIVGLTVAGHATVSVILALFFASWIAVAVIAVAVARRPYREPVGCVPDRERMRSYARRAIVTAAAPIDNLGVDQLAVGLLLTHTDLGLYVIALAFETGPVLVLLALTSVCTPAVAAARHPAVQRAVCLRWLAVGVAAGTAVVVAIQAIIDPVLGWAFGSAALAAVDATRLLVVAGLFLGLRRLTAGMLQGLGRPQHASWAEAAGMLVFALGMFPATARWGVEGACAVMLAAGLVTTTVGAAMVLRGTRQPAPDESVAPSPAT